MRAAFGSDFGGKGGSNGVGYLFGDGTPNSAAGHVSNICTFMYVAEIPIPMIFFLRGVSFHI
jgi:hypothetical protein